MTTTLLIVGGGPIGIACALEARRQDVDCIVLEKGTLVNSIYRYPVNMTFFSTSERLEIGGTPFVSHGPKPTRSEALEYYRRVAKDNAVPVRLFERVTFVERTGSGFLVVSDKNRYDARFVIIATGFYDLPYLLGVPGEDLPKVQHYYKDPHFYAFQKVLVVGAQNSAVDAALETFRKGAEVTMAVRGPEIGQRVKYWVRPDIENRIREGAIKAYFGTTVAAIREGEVDLDTPEGRITITNDWVLALTGYQPNLDFLKASGVRLSEDAVCQPFVQEDTYETNVPGLYLAGVICGGMNTHRLFIENSREHAVRILNDIRSKAGSSGPEGG
ncbi:MAG: YpdA family putative bacillithiol disulfide reductase [Chitinophagaceae bacterium]|nr:MAG: YpdA family putative bacillithiol disulfide reductase [Chitinophagaceae bacterium]